MKIHSYTCGQWLEGQQPGIAVHHAVMGDILGYANTDTIDFQQVLQYGRQVGGPALRAMTVHERALALKNMAKHLLAEKDTFYTLSSATGATMRDSAIDIEGGLSTVLSCSSIARRELPNETFIVEGATVKLSADNSFVGRHILTPKHGVAIHINAFNFPCWGMLEKIAPSLIAGMPVVVKPATVSSYVTAAMVESIVAGNFLPEGALQLICGNTGDMLDHVMEQDVVTFTGSAATGRQLRCHPTIIAHSVPFNMEADSLNCSILAPSVQEGDPEFDLFIAEVHREMIVKAGQKCTAIRRIIVPDNTMTAVADALIARMDKTTIGDPTDDKVDMGSLVGLSQRETVRENVAALAAECEVLYGGNDCAMDLINADAQKGAFYPPTLLRVQSSAHEVTAPHTIEAFGPVSTLLPYQSLEDAVAIAGLGKGSLVASIVSDDDDEIRSLVLGMGAYHGRLLVINRDCAKTSTGHGSPLPHLIHGGPGRAGGGEELGGVRAIKHYMQRTAVQGSPSALTAVTNEYTTGGKTIASPTHLFRKYFDDLQIGESMLTHRRTITETDIVNFGCMSGDHFYAHFDAIAAKQDSIFGERVAHGYLLIAVAAGMFVDPAPGPVLANYGLDNLRFIQSVPIGDTIQVRITVKQKIKKERRPDDSRHAGVVVWEVAIHNQDSELIALYDILTLVELGS